MMSVLVSVSQSKASNEFMFWLEPLKTDKNEGYLWTKLQSAKTWRQTDKMGAKHQIKSNNPNNKATKTEK